MFHWVFWPVHQFLLESLQGQARFVGGAVRNTLLQETPDDFDLATPLDPSTVTSLLKAKGIKVIPTGIAHGTVTAILKGRPYEITTLRRDVHTDGRHATVAFTDSWEVDAARRDFTINAMYVDGQGHLYDYFGGVEDAKKGRICFIGDPAKRIHEDYLRILRFFRFWAYYCHTPDAASLEACCALKKHMVGLSGERITKEMLKMLAAPDPWKAVQGLIDGAFFPFVLGCEKPSQGFEWLAGLEQKLAPYYAPNPLKPWIRLAALSVHTPRLILSRHQRHLLNTLRLPLSPERIFHSLYEDHYKTSEEAKQGTQGRLILTQALNQQIHLEVLVQALQQIESFDPPFFPVSGQDLLERGFSGPQLGERLRKMRTWWIDEKMQPSKTGCLSYMESLDFP